MCYQHQQKEFPTFKTSEALEDKKFIKFFLFNEVLQFMFFLLFSDYFLRGREHINQKTQIKNLKIISTNIRGKGVPASLKPSLGKRKYVSRFWYNTV